MNNKDVEDLNEQAQINYACNCPKKHNKPTAFVCVKCGKCYHKTCIIKNKTIYHLIGNLICCCETETDPKFFEQEITTLTDENSNLKDQLLKEKMNVKSVSSQSAALLEEINELHKKNIGDQDPVLTKQELKYALDKIKNLNLDNAKLLEANSKLETQNYELLEEMSKVTENSKDNTQLKTNSVQILNLTQELNYTKDENLDLKQKLNNCEELIQYLKSDINTKEKDLQKKDKELDYVKKKF